MTTRELLKGALAERFPDGSGRAVMFVGSGLHHHLAAHGVRFPMTTGDAGLRDWNSLLRAARCTLKGPEFEAEHHDDPTATWEGMICARTDTLGAAPQERQIASRHEDILLRRVAKVIEEGTPEADQLGAFGRAVQGVRSRDIVTINFDRTLERALESGQHSKALLKHDVKGERWRSRSSLRLEVGGTRVWHPHGVSAKGVSAATLQLGTVSYSKSVVLVRQAVEEFRRQQSEWRMRRHGGSPPRTWTADEAAAWQFDRREASCKGTWIDQLMNSNIVFLGCGLDRAESDLWLLLHERQRQLARIPASERPKAFFLHPLSRFPSHLTTGPAGLTPIVTQSHDEAWELVLGKWWS